MLARDRRQGAALPSAAGSRIRNAGRARQAGTLRRELPELPKIRPGEKLRRQPTPRIHLVVLPKTTMEADAEPAEEPQPMNDAGDFGVEDEDPFGKRRIGRSNLSVSVLLSALTTGFAQ